MGIIDIVLIGVALSMDAFAVSIAKGLATGRPTWRQALCAGLWFGGFQALMPLLGWLLGSAFASLIAAVDHWIAFALLALIGGNMIREALAEGKDGDADGAEHDASFAPKTMFFLAVATSIDALATGINFALLDVNIWLAIAVIGCITFVLSAAGLMFGGILGERFRKGAQIAGGVVLIAIGVKILVEHLIAG